MADETPGRIPEEELEPRRIYILQARGHVVGVWDAEQRGFIGIRTKFGGEYLFTEFEWDSHERFGTAYATQATEHIVPESIDISEKSFELFDLLKPLTVAERQARRAREDAES